MSFDLAGLLILIGVTATPILGLLYLARRQARRKQAERVLVRQYRDTP